MFVLPTAVGDLGGQPLERHRMSGLRVTGCSDCAWTTRGHSRALAPAGISLADLHRRIAGEFIQNLDRPDFSRAASGRFPTTVPVAMLGLSPCLAVDGGQPHERPRLPGLL